MCLLAFAIDSHPRYRLVLAANRDEKFVRPTAPAGFWPDDRRILAGRDLEAGGTWLGVSQNGRLAALTNYYAPAEYATGKPSRGRLVADFLTSDTAPEAYLERIHNQGERYNGYGLVFGDSSGLHFATNRGDSLYALPAGAHGLSNHLINTPWPKVVSLKAGLQRVLAHSDIIDPEELFTLLSDRTRYPEYLLPDTGVGIDRERRLSSIFVTLPEFGTRCSTVILIDRDHRMTFVERSFDARRNITGTVEFQLSMNDAVPSEA